MCVSGWKLFILYFLGSKLAFGSNNDCMHHMDTIWIAFAIQMSQFRFNSKNGIGV